MAAGLGFKTFTTGEVLTAADTNGYLMQGVLVFASSAARAAAITSPQEGQYSYLKDTNSTEYYDGAAWIAAPIGDITGVTAGTGISGGGTSGTVTVTNSMATEIAAKGDLIVGTGAATFDNLAVGTNGQTLVADSTASTGLKWATPATASSGFTYITSSTFSNVASVSVDGCFSSTYETYMITINNLSAATGGDTPRLGLRYSSTDQTTAHYSSFWYHNPVSDAYYGSRARDVGYVPIGRYCGSSTYPTSGAIMIGSIGTDTRPSIWGQTGNSDTESAVSIGGTVTQPRTYTGFKLTSSSTNITGTVRVYGLAKS